MADVVRTYVPAESVEEQWDLPGLEKVLREEWQVDVAARRAGREERRRSPTKTSSRRCSRRPTSCSRARSTRVGIEQFTPFMRMILLQSIDQHWREHLAALDYLRQGIHLRGYAQKNPKQEYKREAFELFSQLLDVVKMDVTRMLMTVRIQSRGGGGARPPRRSRSAPSTSATSPTRTRTTTAASPKSAAANRRPRRRRWARWRRRWRHRASRRARCRRSGATILVLAGAGRSTSSATAGWPEP